MKLDVKVMFVSRYDFINKDTGEQISGCKLTLMDKSEINSDNSFGHKVYTVNTSLEVYKSMLDKTGGKTPFDCVAEFEIQSLDKAPRFKQLIY